MRREVKNGKENAIGFILALLLIVTIAFSGCIEEELLIKAPETAVPPTTTSNQIPVEEEIEVLVKELGYDDEIAQYVAHVANSWTDPQENPVLQGWKGELRGTREQYEESKITKKLSQKIKEEIPDYNEDNWHLEKVIRNKEANCFGYTQLLFVLGIAINLSVVPVDVRVEIGNIRGDHSACLINLSDARNMILVDLISSPALISEPFMLEKEYEKIDNYFELINKDNIMILHPRFRICDEDVLIAGIINSRGTTYADLGEHQKAISDYTKAIELGPEYAGTYVRRGTTYLIIGEPQKAQRDFDMAIGLDPRLGGVVQKIFDWFIAEGGYE